MGRERVLRLALRRGIKTGRRSKTVTTSMGDSWRMRPMRTSYLKKSANEA
jgi:hypothetical protein